MKKGFTLIELLAVIVILAIIALIATSLILNVIDDSKKGAFKNTAYGIIEAAELSYAKNIMDGTKTEITYTYVDGKQTEPENKNLEFKGAKPESGNVFVSKEGKTAILIFNGKLCAEKTFDETEVRLTNRSKENCQISETFECGKTLFDKRDGNAYATVLINDQCWMAEDLRYTGNGCLDKTWDSGKYDACRKATTEELQNNSSHKEWLKYEVWYQLAAALDWDCVNPASPTLFANDHQGICPDGWAIPNSTNTSKLMGYTTSFIQTVDKLKSSIYWDGTDDYGFNALPVGNVNSNNELSYVGELGMWSINSYYNDRVMATLFSSNDNQAYITVRYYSDANALRCIKKP